MDRVTFENLARKVLDNKVFRLTQSINDHRFYLGEVKTPYCICFELSLHLSKSIENLVRRWAFQSLFPVQSEK